MKKKYIEISSLPNFEVTCSDGKQYVLLPFEHLSDIPVADAIEVVRCKDCEHCIEWNNYNPPQYTCRIWADQWGIPSETEPDGYCHYGELKD